jgi:hypothetical protein
MRSAVFAALVPGLFVLTPVASAQTTTEPALPVYLQLSAYSGHAGEKVSVAAACGEGAGPLTSQALRVTAPLAANTEGHQPWALFAETVVGAVQPGSYPVSFHCGGEPVTVQFTVLARQVPVVPKGSPHVRVVPKGAPQTGDGSLALG